MSHTKIQLLKKQLCHKIMKTKNSMLTHSKHLKQNWIADKNNKGLNFTFNVLLYLCLFIAYLSFGTFLAKTIVNGVSQMFNWRTIIPLWLSLNARHQKYNTLFSFYWNKTWKVCINRGSKTLYSFWCLQVSREFWEWRADRIGEGIVEGKALYTGLL